MNANRMAGALALLLLQGPAYAANDRFAKDRPDSMNGFAVVTDEKYRHECGSCHIAYSPGLLPSRSWDLVLQRLDKHFGETVSLRPEERAAISSYLASNAMDHSAYAGSRVLLEKLPDNYTPPRIMLMPYLAYNHAVIREAISKNGKVEVKRLANCSQCHTKAEAGSFSIDELFIPGLTKRPHA